MMVVVVVSVREAGISEESREVNTAHMFFLFYACLPTSSRALRPMPLVIVVMRILHHFYAFRSRSMIGKANLLLHYGRQMVAVKGDNLSILEAENIDTGDIDCLARGSDSLGTNGQLTVMRSPYSMLDDHDVPRGVNARYFTADIWKGP